MSHIATNWAFQQRGLKPSAKIILLALADCHNPVHGCFPTQAYLSDVCEVNRDTVNAQLNTLEDRGLIRRVRSVDPQTRRQRPTRYKLAFEGDFTLTDEVETAPGKAGNPVSEIPTQTRKAVSEKPAEPCRKNAESRVGNSDTNLVKEQVIKPARTPARDGAPAEAEQADEDFQRFWLAHPRPRNRDRTWQAWQAVKMGGAEPARIIEAVRRYAIISSGLEPQYRVSSETWLEDRRWQDQEPGLQACPGPVTPQAEFWAKTIQSGRHVAASAISHQLAREMVSAGLVGAQDLRRIGVYL